MGEKMSEKTPAWSWQFAPEARVSLPQPSLFHPLTWDQVCGESTGQGVKVAVIDSGIDATHPGVAGEVQGYVMLEEQADDFVYNTDPHEDASGHGTACTSIIRSLAPDCEIYSVRVLGKWSLGRGAVFLAGVRWAIEHGMQICNLSLGTTRKDLFGALHELADLAYFRRTLLVTAANNLPIPSFPSMYASVISVAAHAEKDPYCFYYNPHPPVEFGAPGIDVRVAWQNHQWITATGNSFAAPHITGILARILAKNPDFTPFQAKAVLHALARNISAGTAGTTRDE
jgi:subtilisin family serine protease